MFVKGKQEQVISLIDKNEWDFPFVIGQYFIIKPFDILKNITKNYFPVIKNIRTSTPNFGVDLLNMFSEIKFQLNCDWMRLMR